MTYSKLKTCLIGVLLLSLGLSAPVAATAQTALKTVVTSPQVRAELLAHAPQGAGAGKAVWVGLQLTHAPGWHTYWKNSGDSGLPTSLVWTLPNGVTAGDINWPLPKKIPIGNLLNYGFEGTALLAVPLTITPAFKPSLLGQDLEIKLKASWLVCRQACIPEEGEFALRLAVQGSTALNGAAFEANRLAQPLLLSGPSKAAVDGQTLKLTVANLPAALQGQTLALFAQTPEVIQTAGAWTQAWAGAVWTAQLPLSAERRDSPTQMPFLLVADTKGKQQGFLTQAGVRGPWPAPLAATAVAPLSPALAAALQANANNNTGTGLSVPANPASTLGFWAALLGALLGGLLLNLMPCVFPVLAIKVMSFARHAHDRRAHRLSGLAFSAGVVLSFVALGALMLGLRSAGEHLGWGFQLQAPAVVAALAVLFTVMGLNLAGLFEFGQFVPSRLATLEAKNPSVNAFLSGVLAVAIASPCTAPFMGASLGLALGLPAAQALLIFASIGVGMAVPYLTASLVPAVATWLPRPGAWMGTLRHALAFPMLATVVWLLWVLGQQTGVDGASALLLLLLGLSGVLWSLTFKGRTRLVFATVSIAAYAMLLAFAGPFVLKPLAANSASATERWQPWSPERVAQDVASGRPVFVDFTAAWCVTCQYNKQSTLSNPAVLADFEAKKVSLLRADWTRRDPTITAALRALGRSGVPVYVLYQSGQAPVLLSEILSVAEVRTALKGL